MEPTEREEPRSWNDTRKPATSAPVSAPVAKPKTVDKKPGLGQRWRNYHPTKGILIWACLGSIALTMLIGFKWGGWQTTGGAERRSQTVLSAALVERLAPICFNQYNRDPDKAAKVAAMEGMTSRETTAYVQEQGWATISGVEKPDRNVAAACTKLLLASSQ